MAAGLAALEHEEYTKKNCEIIKTNRRFTASELKKLGFVLTNSSANFVFAKHPEISGKDIYKKLKEKGILIRHFESERICEYNRITIGTKEQTEALIRALKEIIEKE